MDETQKWLLSLNDKKASRTGAFVTRDDRNPDALAESLRIGGELGVPALSVGADPAPYRRELEEKKATEALKGAPRTQEWLRGVNNGALAKDDVENASWFEKNVLQSQGALTRAAGRGIARLGASGDTLTTISRARQAEDFGKTFDQLYAEELQRFGGENAPAFMKTNAQLIAKQRFDAVQGKTRDEIVQEGGEALARAQAAMAQAATSEMSEGAAAFRDGPLANADNSVLGVLRAFAEDPVGGASFVTQVAAESLPQMFAGTAVTVATRSPVAGAIAMGAGSFLAENTAAANEFLSEQGVDMSTPEAAALVLDNPELMQEAARRGLTRGVIISLFDAASGGIAGQTLMRSPAGEMVAQGLAQIAFGSGGEYTAQRAVGDPVDWREVVLEGIAELVTAPIEIGGVGGRALFRQLGRLSRSGETSAALSEIDQQAQQSKLKQRMPAKFRELLDSVGAGDALLYVPADAMREFFQAKDMDPETAAFEYGFSAREFAEMETSGSDIAIPASVFAEKISGTEDVDFFLQNATFSPDEMSQAEAAEFNERVGDAMREAFDEAERRRLADLETRASDEQVYDGFYSQLRVAGRTRDVAQREAQVLSAFFRSMSDRYGEDSLDLARQFGLEIRGPEAQSFRRRGNLDILLNTVRSGRIRRPGVSLADFVKDMGGVQDEGGDLAAADAPRGIIAETQEQISERRSQGSMFGTGAGKGVSIEDAARRAAEAGFFPDLMGEAMGEAGVSERMVDRFREALLGEIAGEPVYVPGDEGDAEAEALQAYLDEFGIDLATMTNDEVVALLDQQQEAETLEQPGKRGSIQFPKGGLQDGQTVISLFEDADLSTMLHETGHYFLEAFTALASTPEAPQAMKDDLAAIRSFLEIEGDAVPTREQHEKWARGFEAYAMEGKAPSLALADAFARFKAWLTRIYRTARGLNVRLTPEVREVMDRMLATDAEIAAARESQSMSPLFTDQAAAGMSDAAWNTYQRMARRGEEQAAQNLLEKTMEKVRREKTKWWKAERKDVRAEVEGFVSSQRQHRLVEMLANQRWIGDDARQVPDIQMDKAELVETFGDGVLAELSRQRLGGKRAIYTSGGAPLGEVAELFGFSGPVEMIQILQNTGKRTAEIEAETDRIMSERYGDPLNDGTIEEEALEAIHSEQQAKQVVAEVRALAQLGGLKRTGLSSRMFKMRAQRMIANMSIREATRPDAFLAAERKAAKRAEDAFARVARGGGVEVLATAARHKEQQLLNHYLYLEAKGLQRSVERAREKVMGYSKTKVRQKLAGGYIEQIDALVEQYDFRRRSQGQIARSESLKAFVERMEAEGRGGEIDIDHRLIERANRVHYSRLSVDEFMGLMDTINNIDHMGRFKQKLIDRKRQRELDESASRVAGQIRKNLGTGKAKQQSGFIRNTFDLLFTTDTMLVEMDGGAEIGPAYDEIKASIDEGASLEAQMQVELAERIDEVFTVYSRKELREMTKPKQVSGANGRAWSKLEIISVALNMGNEDNRQRLFDQNAHPENRLTPDQADALLSEMTKRDWDFVQSMWDLINSYGDQTAEVHERRTGNKMKRVEAVPVETPFGTYRGGYYPIKYDSQLSAKAAKDEGSAWDKFLSNGWGAKTEVNSGMTKTRKSTSGGRTLKLDMSVPFSHLKDTVRLIALSEAVDNTVRILNHPQVADAFMDAGRATEAQTLKLWLKDVAQGPIMNSDPLNSLARMMKNNFTLSRLAFNLKTVALQITGVAQSAAVIGKKNALRGYLDYRKRPLELAREVVAKSPFMAERETTFQKDIYDFANDVDTAGPLQSQWKRIKSDVGKAGFWPMIKVQFYSVDLPTWLGAYRSGLEQYKGDEQKAIHYADRMVARAQDSGIMADRSAFERGTVSPGVQQADFIRLFTTLGGYMIKKMNRGYITSRRAVLGIRDADSNVERLAVAGNAALDLSLLYVTEAVMMGLMYALLDEMGDDEREDDDLAKFIAKETGMAIVGGVPIVRDVASAFQGYGGGGVYGSIAEIPSDIFRQSVQGEADTAFWRAWANGIGAATGLPTTAPMRVLEGALDDDKPIAEWAFGSNPLTR